MELITIPTIIFKITVSDG